MLEKRKYSAQECVETKDGGSQRLRFGAEEMNRCLVECVPNNSHLKKYHYILEKVAQNVNRGASYADSRDFLPG